MAQPVRHAGEFDACIKHVRTPTLDIAYEETGEGAPVILLHGFPYAPRAFDGMLPLLAGCRVIVPYLRGYGPTRFLSPTRCARASRPRSATT